MRSPKPSKTSNCPAPRIVWLLAVLCAPAFSHAAQLAPVFNGVTSQRAILQQYCFGCHNEKLTSGGISLATLDLSDVSGHAAVLEKVLSKLRAGEMPPAGMPRPDAATVTAFTHSLQSELDEAATAHPNPGHPVIHRLNRAEYSNAVRDLLSLDIKPGSLLPADDTGYGFDNIGDVLSLSPMLIERYLSVARTVSRLAVGDTAVKPEIAEFRPPKSLAKNGPRHNERVADDLPFGSAGGLSVSYRFPVDAEYLIKFTLAPNTGFDGPQVSKSFEMRLPVKAGTRVVGVTFPRQDAVTEFVPKPGSTEGDGSGNALKTEPGPPTFADLRLDGARLKTYELTDEGKAPVLSTLTISGPYNIAGPGDTPSRRKIFVCQPADGRDEQPCAKKILSSLAYHAFRRPVTDQDVEPLLAFYRAGRQDGGSFENGVESALRALLVSPDFLFRIEHDPSGLPAGSAFRVSDYELASRLSFFLWSSIPDDQLLDLAQQGKLKDPAVLSQQVTRMLDDSRSQALVSDFAGQWLYLRNLAQVRPDPDEFPEFDTSLRLSFQRETELFFADILRSDRPVTDLLDAKYSFINQRLADHYGMHDIYGSQFRKVELTDPNRGGILGQGSILTVTSYPNRTSVVQRGKWVLDNLLGAPPPPPPPNVPSLKGHGEDGSNLTMREQMEQHRANPICASCHSRMDPIGFALENYDGVGRWRDKDSGHVIDASGKLPDGTKFDGPQGLRTILLTKRKDQFVNTVAQRLLTYALGRGLEPSDNPAVRSIVREASGTTPDCPPPSMQALIRAIVNSVPFQMRRTPES